MTALHAAVSQGDLHMAKLLLANGADVHAMGVYVKKFPRSLLTEAVDRNEIDLVKVILYAGVDVNIPSFGVYWWYSFRIRNLSLAWLRNLRPLGCQRGAAYFAVQQRISTNTTSKGCLGRRSR